MKAALKLVESGLVPKPLLRRGIRGLLRERIREGERLFGPDRERALVSDVASGARRDRLLSNRTATFVSASTARLRN